MDKSGLCFKSGLFQPDRIVVNKLEVSQIVKSLKATFPYKIILH